MLSKVDKSSQGLVYVSVPVQVEVLHYEWEGRSPAIQPEGGKPNISHMSFTQHVPYCLPWNL